MSIVFNSATIHCSTRCECENLFDIPTSVERLICSHAVINVDLSITFQFNDDIWLICVISVGDMIVLIR